MAFVSGLMGPYMSPIPINSSLGHAHLTGRRLDRHAMAVRPAACWDAARCVRHWPRGHAGRGCTESGLDRLFRRLLMPFLDTHTGSAARRWLSAGFRSSA
jgi:hypothetical protein